MILSFATISQGEKADTALQPGDALPPALIRSTSEGPPVNDTLVSATASITFTGSPNANSTVTIGSTVYGLNVPTGPLGPTDMAPPFPQTTTNWATALAYRINTHSDGSHDPLVTAVAVNNVVTLTAIVKGAAGNAITLSETADDVSVSGGTLTSGAGVAGTPGGIVGSLCRTGDASPYRWDRWDGDMWHEIEGEIATTPSSIASTDITDSTSVGRSLLTAANAAAQRALIGATADYRTDGATYQDFDWMGTPTVIADGPDAFGRQYHAFPSQPLRVGNDIFISYTTTHTHGSMDSDLIIVKSSDWGKTWTEKKRFAASNPNAGIVGGTVVVGDYEYRAASLTDIGGGCIVAMLDRQTIVSGNDTTYPYTYSVAEGRRSWWSLSIDGGTTWSAPTKMPDWSGGGATDYSISGYGEAVWKGYYYAAFYGSANSRGVMRCSVESLRSGIPQWEECEAGDFYQECQVLVNPTNPDELWVVGRANDTRIAYRTSTDGLNWSAFKTSYYGLEAESSAGIKPQMALTGNGNWILANRYSTTDITGEIVTGANPFPLYSGVGSADTQQWPVKRNREFPNPFSRYNSRAYMGIEKSMYYGFLPISGDLVGVVASYSPMEYSTVAYSAGGHRSSIMFGYYGSGTGRTPWGDFSKAEVELKGSAVTLNESRNYFSWMTANTQYTITDGSATVALEIFGDYIPTFHDGTSLITPTGSYNPNARNVAIINPGPSVAIINQAPPAPSEIPSLAKNVLIQLSPAGIHATGSNVDTWDNEGDTSYVASLLGGTTKPTVVSGGSPNGRNCVQGASNAYLSNAGADTNVEAIYALMTAEGSTWAGSYSSIITNAIQGTSAGTAVWQSGVPWTAAFRYIDGALDDPPAAPSTTWHLVSLRRPNAPTGNGSNYVNPTTTTNMSVIMSQSGYTTTRGWRGKMAALVMLKQGHYTTDREDYLIRRWMRSL